MKYELKEPIENAYVVGFTKSRRIAWVGHVMQMDDKRTPKKILEWKPIGTKLQEDQRRDGSLILKKILNNRNKRVEKG